jgi:hypothetical protein
MDDARQTGRRTPTTDAHLQSHRSLRREMETPERAWTGHGGRLHPLSQSHASGLRVGFHCYDE